MNDYSDIIQVIGAMLLVSLLVQTANRSNISNSQLLLEAEYETAITAIAQDLMDESRSLAFDEETEDGFVPVNIPADFSTIGADGGEDTDDRNSYDDFDDYDGWSGIISTDLGEFNVSVEVEYIDNSYNKIVSNSTLKAMYITVTNPFMVQGDGKSLKQYSFSMIRSYYAE